MTKTASQKLLAAALRGDLEAVKDARAQGASLRAEDDASMSALALAAREGHAQVVAYLLEQGAEVTDPTIELAARSAASTPAIVKRLQLAQLRQVKPQTSGQSAADARLLIAAFNGDVAALTRAIRAGARVNASDDQDTSALRWAARGGHHAALKALLDAGADVNQKSSTGWTALMEAVLAASEESLPLLLEGRASVDARTADGASVLSLAQDMVELSSEPERARRISRRLGEMTLLEEFSNQSGEPHIENSGETKPAGEDGLPRYKAMALLVDQAPLAPDEFAKIVAQHHEFIESGGGGGRWLTLVTEDDPETGLIIGLYEGEQNKEAKGAQANLEHKRLAGLDLRGVELPFANLLGVSARAQDLRGANLAGVLATDSDFTGANFQQANLSGADFSRSELSGCDFRGANLTNTDLQNADLSGVDLSGANTIGTSFIGALLS